MKKLLLTALFVAMVCGIAAAADSNPSLLINTPLPAPVPCAAPVEPVCAPAPPVCPPPAPAPAPACPAPAVANVCAPREEIKVVPVKRKVYVDEVYTVNEKRTEMVDEIRTRTATRKVPVIVPVTKAEVKLSVVEPCSGNAPRLSRQIKKKVVPVTKMETETYTETYTAKVKQTTEVPVVKTRRVSKTVDEVQLVTVRR